MTIAEDELLDFVYSDPLAVASDQTTQDLIDAAAAVELEQLFTTVCGNGSMLPGITQGKQKLTAIYPAKEIGDRLIRRCCEVVDHFYHTVTTDDKRDLAIAKAQQLPLKLKQKQDRLNQLMSAELPQLEMSLFSEITEYCKVLRAMAEAVVKLIKEFQCKYELEKNLALNEYFNLVIRNIQLKISCMQAELNRTLFPQDIIQLMNAVREKMEENFRQLLSTKQSIEEELRKYSNAGQDFHRIVSDYQALLGDIANVRRDLSMLQQNLTCPIDQHQQILCEIERDLGDTVHQLSTFPLIYRVNGSHNISHIGPYQRGQMLGMDITSAIAVFALSIERGDHVLDLCCAPGAKLALIRSIQQLECIGAGLDPVQYGSVTGVDIAKQRLFNCRALVRKCRMAQNVRLFCADGCKFNIAAPRRIFQRLFNEPILDTTAKVSAVNSALQSNNCVPVFQSKLLAQNPIEIIAPDTFYDKVLVDAECTHDGSLVHVAKHFNRPADDISARINMKDLDALESLQRQLLDSGFRALRPGGVLVYSTCSFASRQNESIIYWFLERYGPEVALLDAVPGADQLDFGSSPNAAAMERSVDEHFYSTAPNKQLASQIRQKTLRFYGDMVRERDGGECFWASGFFAAKIRKV